MMIGNRILVTLVLASMGVVFGSSDAYAWGRAGCFGRASGCYGVSSGCYGIVAACYGSSANFFGVTSGCYGSSNCFSSSSCYGWSGGYSGVLTSCYSVSSGGCYASASVDGYEVGCTYQTTPTALTVAPPQAIRSTDPSSATSFPVVSEPVVVLRTDPTKTPEVAAEASPRHTPRTPQTLLTLQVPDQAMVSLEGTSTRLTGPQRVFQSVRLAEGQVWRDYRVRVVVEREGREHVQEKRLDLRGGQAHELRFDFDDSRLASR